MSKFGKFLGAAAVLASVALTTSVAQAAPIFSSGSFAMAFTTSTTTSVLTTNVFTLTSGITASSPVDDFTLAPLLSPLSSPGSVDFTNFSSLNFSDPVFGTFTGSALGTHTTTNLDPFFIAFWTISGTFTTGTEWGNPGATFTANETWSCTQTGSQADAISCSGTFHSPAAVRTPEPLTLSLFGAGLAGAAAFRRRRKNKATA